MKNTLCVMLAFLSAAAVSQPKQELRGVWITNVDSYVMNSDAAIAAGMNYLASINVNVVFPVVWNAGYTLYPSDVMAKNFGKPIHPSFSGRDPLKRLIIEAHRNGIEVVPWFEYGFAASYGLNGGHLVAARPSWASKNADGKLTTKNGFDWLSGINPEVQNFMTSIVTETLDKYDVDGVQGDDRLPALPAEGGYDSVTVSLYKAEHGGVAPPAHYEDNVWMRWRANKLTAYFGRLRDSVKARGAGLLFSSAPTVYPWGYDNYLQDSKTWVESGIVDNFIPQVYRYSLSEYNATLYQQLFTIPESKRGIFFAGVLAKSGSYVIDPGFLLDCVKANRSRGVNGETFFFYEALRRDNNRLGDTLRASFYREPALLPYRGGMVYRPKGLVVNEDDPDAAQSGTWNYTLVSGYAGGILTASDTGSASLTYSFRIPKKAYYDVFAFIPGRLAKSTQTATYAIRGALETLHTTIDQTDPALVGWQLIGTVLADSGYRPIVTVSNANIGAGKIVAADGVMLLINRKRSPSVQFATAIPMHERGIAKDFELHQNFPNPFNPSTHIRFSISARQMVRLQVFDVLGRVVATLVEGTVAPGTHTVAWNTRGVTSGVYFYRLETAAFAETRKLIVQK